MDMKKARKWVAFRKKFLKGRENFQGYYICEKCGKWIKYPEVHHKEKRSVNPSKVFDESNLEVLCYECHLARHDLKL